jgi:L-glyceraldehyde 3-phosphate reductase
MTYTASSERYENMVYNRCGDSGLKLPAISLGLWHNFGDVDDFENARRLIHTAFDSGITHFDLANNYGPPKDLAPYRDELIISTKAGYGMWPGPYGDWGSKKYLTASLDQSLKRMRLDYVDIFYSHRPDPETIPTPRSKKRWRHWPRPFDRARRSMRVSPIIRLSKPNEPPPSSTTWAFAY